MSESLDLPDKLTGLNLSEDKNNDLNLKQTEVSIVVKFGTFLT